MVTGAALFGTAQIGTNLVSTVSNVEMGMTKIMRVMEDATADMVTMRTELFSLGEEFGQSWDTVQDIAMRWAQAGYNMTDTIELTRTALLALNTAELNSEQATQGMIAIMSQWNLTAKDLLPTLDKINKVADDYAISSQEIIDGLVRSSGAAKVMNLTLEQTIGILTAMREASGRTGKEVGNALNSILSFMQRPKSIEAFEKSGISVFADAAKTTYRNATDNFTDLAAKWNAIGTDVQESFMQSAEAAGLYADEMAILSDAEKSELAAAGGSLYRRNYFIALLERWNVVSKAVATQETALGYSMQENARTMETLEKKWQSLKTAVEELYVTAGDAGLLDVLKGLVDGSKEAIETFQKLPGPIKDTTIVLLELGVALTAVNLAMKIFGVGAMSNGLVGLAAHIGKVEKATLGLTQALRILVTSPAVKIGGVAAAVFGLIYAMDKYKEYQGEQFDTWKQEEKRLAELAEKYKILKGQLGKNAEAELEMKSVIEEILKIRPDLLASYDAETGKAKILEDQLYKTAEARKKSAEFERLNILATYKPQIDKLLDEKTAIVQSNKTKEEQQKLLFPGSPRSGMSIENQRRLREIDDELLRLNNAWLKASGMTEEQIKKMNANAKNAGMPHSVGTGKGSTASGAGPSDAYNPWDSAKITSRFGEKRASGPHQGLDIAMKQGTELEAVGSGVITSKGKDNKGNAFVTIKLESGEEVTYVHLSKLPDAKVGSAVKAGDIIGLSGGKPGSWGAGNSTGEHLDLRVRVNGKYIDPENWLSGLKGEKPKGNVFDYTGYENEDNYDKQVKTFVDKYKSKTKGYDNSLESYETTVKATKAELEQLKVREQLYEKTEQYELLQRNLTQQVAVYARQQGELKALNDKNKVVLSNVNLDMSELNKQYKAGKISTDAYNGAMQELKDLQNKLTVEIEQNSAAWWENQSALVDVGRAYAKLTKERVAKLRELISKEADMNRISLEQQIGYLQSLKKAYQLSADEIMEIDQDIIKARGKLLDKSFKDVQKKYKDMVDKISQDAKNKTKGLEDQIAGLDAEQKNDDRADAEEDYNKKLADLQKERQYHEKRTGKEHKKAIKDIDEQIAEEKRKWQERQDDWARDDKKDALQKQIDDTKDAAEEEKRILEQRYDKVKEIAEDGILDTIAAISALKPQWFETGKALINQLIEGLKSGDFSKVQETINAVKQENKSQGEPSANTIQDKINAVTKLTTISKGQYEMQNNKAIMKSRNLASILGESVNWDNKTQEVIIDGKRFQPAKNVNGTSWVNVREVAEVLGYGVKWNDDWSIDLLPKAHTGALGLKEGIALIRNDERVLSPIMTTKFDELTSMLAKMPSLKGLGGTSVYLTGPLFNSEKTILENELDVEITGRQLWKSTKSIGRVRG
jgi:TP901 family phage tail tape measure protein